MSPARPEDVTDMLERWRAGEREVADALFAAVRRELDRIAHRYLAGERSGHTLETAALVNEAYLKLFDQRRSEWHSRAHFLAIAAQSMRRILVDRARARGAHKRGGDAIRITFDERGLASDDRDALAVHDALERLAALDPTRAKIVELRFFGGLTHPEIAEVLGVSLSTVERNWRLARAWLHRELR